MKIQIKAPAILLYSLLGLAILWGPTASADPVDAVADLVLVLGQPNFTSNTANNGGVSTSSLNLPRKVAVDTAGNVYVADTANHRVLVYLDPQNTDTVADLVLGKFNFFTSKCNIDFVGDKVVSASTLCSPAGIAVDAAGNVYVADGNNRVLEYHTPLTTDTVADVVLGQPNFTSNTANSGGVSASSLHRAHGVAVDTAGKVYVVDLYNNRVLVYDGFLDLTPMLTCACYDDPFATPLALKKKTKRPIPLTMDLLDNIGDVITDTNISSSPVVNVLFSGQAF